MAIAVHDTTPSLAERMGLSAEQLNLIRNTVARGATDTELEFFLLTAKRAGLDPLSRQIHFIKRNVKNADGQWESVATIQTGIDGYRAIAERSGEYDGQDEPKFVMSDDGVTPISCTVTVYRKGMTRGISATAYWNEYVQTRWDDKKKAFVPVGLWGKMPRNQLAKCAEALALRKAFPLVMSSIYTHEEMEQAANDEVVRVPTVQPVEPRVDAGAELPAPQPASSAEPSMPTRTQAVKTQLMQRDQRKQLVDHCYDLMRSLGWDRKQAADYLTDRFGDPSFRNASQHDLEIVLADLESRIPSVVADDAEIAEEEEVPED